MTDNFDRDVSKRSQALEELKDYRQQELEYIKVQLVCLLPYQTFKKAHQKLER